MGKSFFKLFLKPSTESNLWAQRKWAWRDKDMEKMVEILINGENRGNLIGWIAVPKTENR